MVKWFLVVSLFGWVTWRAATKVRQRATGVGQAVVVSR